MAFPGSSVWSKPWRIGFLKKINLLILLDNQFGLCFD